MIKYIKGDLFSSPAQVLVNTVNLDGVMGKGIALKFKKLYPEMFTKYQKFCENKMLEMGKLWLYKSEKKWILNFPTKIHWRNPSKIEYIEIGLQKFVAMYKEKNITSIAFPKLGCGNGGLKWEDVKPLMDYYLKNLPIEIYIYEDEFKTDKEFKNINETKKRLSLHPKDLSFIEYKSDIDRVAMAHNIDITSIEENLLKDFWNSLKNNHFVTYDNNSKQNQVIYNLTSMLDYVIPCQSSNGLNGIVYNTLQLRLPLEDNVCQSQMNF